MTEQTTNDLLRDAFRHHSWATKQLLAACRPLAAEQLTEPSAGGYGSILDTFNHIVLSDAGYVRRLTNAVPAWATERISSGTLDALAARVEALAHIWEQVLAGPIDAEQVLVLDEGSYETHVGVIIAQALHHGNAHREQICAMLTAFGVEPPDIQAWGYADATGRGRERNGSTAQPEA